MRHARPALLIGLGVWQGEVVHKAKRMRVALKREPQFEDDTPSIRETRANV